MHLCKYLKPILDSELNNGNQIDEISTGWSNAEYVVDLTNLVTQR